MDYEQDRKNLAAMDARKQYDARNIGNQAEARETYNTPTRGVLTGSDIARRSIRQRIEEALNQANSAIRRAESAQRARQIIEAHPELADLLDALNEF